MTMTRSQLRHQANIASAKQPTNSQQISFELVGGVFFQRTDVAACRLERWVRRKFYGGKNAGNINDGPRQRQLPKVQRSGIDRCVMRLFGD